MSRAARDMTFWTMGESFRKKEIMWNFKIQASVFLINKKRPRMFASQLKIYMLNVKFIRIDGASKGRIKVFDPCAKKSPPKIPWNVLTQTWKNLCELAEKKARNTNTHPNVRFNSFRGMVLIETFYTGWAKTKMMNYFAAREKNSRRRTA